MGESKNVVKVTVTEDDNKNDSGEYTSVNPIKDFNLGEQAYKVVRLDIADTEKELEGLGMSYYTVKGGEILSKKFNEDRSAILFNHEPGLSDQFEVPLKPGRRSYDRFSETWYADKKTAFTIATELTEIELEKSNKALKKHQEAAAFLQSQMDKNQF